MREERRLPPPAAVPTPVSTFKSKFEFANVTLSTVEIPVEDHHRAEGEYHRLRRQHCQHVAVTVIDAIEPCERAFFLALGGGFYCELFFFKAREMQSETRKCKATVQLEGVMTGRWYRIFSRKCVPHITPIDRYPGIGNRKYLRYSKVHVL